MKLFRHLLSYIPTRLPVGLTAFQDWSDDVLYLTGPIADRDSMRFALASIITHLGPQQSVMSKRFFVKSLWMAGAKQVAAQVFQDIKNAQIEKQKAAATASPEVANAEEPKLQ